MITAAKPKGYIIFTIRKSFWTDDGFQKRMDELEADCLVTKVQETEYTRFHIGLETEAYKPCKSQLLVYQKN